MKKLIAVAAVLLATTVLASADQTFPGDGPGAGDAAANHALVVRNLHDAGPLNTSTGPFPGDALGAVSAEVAAALVARNLHDAGLTAAQAAAVNIN